MGQARSHHVAARVDRYVYLFGGQRWTMDAGTVESAELASESTAFQMLDTVTGHVQPLEPTGSDCMWPEPRASAVLITWRARFLVMFGGMVSHTSPLLLHCLMPFLGCLIQEHQDFHLLGS
jgi:hypothetical protein